MFKAFMEQHFILVIIGSVVGGIIIIVLVIAGILSVVTKRKKGGDSVPLTKLHARKDPKTNSRNVDSVHFSRGEKQALSLLLRTNQD